MTKILILGGYGYTGRLLSRHLLQQSNVEIILAGRHLEKAQSYASQLNAEFAGQRVSAIHMDAASRGDLQTALQGADMLVVAAPTTRCAETVIRAALDCGVDYLDVQLDTGKLKILNALAPQIEQAGLCFITEAGFHPGLPAAMVRAAAAKLDRLESAVTAAYLNMGQSMPYTEAVDELMELFKDYQAQVFKDGAWTKSSSYEIRKVDFGGGIGMRRCYSMFLEEMRPLPEMYPGLREVGFYMSETHWLLDWVIFPLVYAGLKLFRAAPSARWDGCCGGDGRTCPNRPTLCCLRWRRTARKTENPPGWRCPYRMAMVTSSPLSRWRLVFCSI